MSIEVIYDSDRAEAVVSPPHGKRVAFVVERRKIDTARRGSYYRRMAERWVVGLRGSGDCFTWHTSYDRACQSLLSRARRYDRAYSVPRGVAS